MNDKSPLVRDRGASAPGDEVVSGICCCWPFPAKLTRTNRSVGYAAMPLCLSPGRARSDKCVDNVETNLGPLGLTGNVCVRRLRWGSAEDLAACDPPYEMVIAGDCLYEEACIAPLLETMWELAGPETEVCLLYFCLSLFVSVLYYSDLAML